MIELVTFASPDMERSMRLCLNSAIAHGVDLASPWFPLALRHTDFYEKNKVILDNPRGAGLWAWKPYIIRHQMALMPDGHVLIYSDAGVEFIDNVNHIIDRMDQDILLFGNQWPHYAWCKRDAMEAVWPSESLDGTHVDTSTKPWDRFGKQVQASVIFFKVSDYTRKFVKEWLFWCTEGVRSQDGSISYFIDDSPSFLPNHPEFQEHRHDQSILTTLSYRDGLKLHAWPAVYNRFLGQEFVYSRDGYPESDNYPSLFHHHRRRNADWTAAA